MTRVLVISPHTDDAEVGAGGTIMKFKDKFEIFHVGMSACQDISRNKAFDLATEFKAANDFLGIKAEVYEFVNRRFSEQAFQIRECFERLKRNFTPDIILCPAACDIHQDHQTIYAEAFRVFRNCTILGYESPRSSIGFRPTLYIILDEETVKRKCKLITLYKSQSKEYYMQKKVTRANLRHRGAEVGREFAEGFEIIRMVVS